MESRPARLGVHPERAGHESLQDLTFQKTVGSPDVLCRQVRNLDFAQLQRQLPPPVYRKSPSLTSTSEAAVDGHVAILRIFGQGPASVAW